MAHYAGENWQRTKLSQAIVLPFKIYKSRFYNWYSRMVMTSSFLICKVFIERLTRTKCFNMNRLNHYVAHRPPNVGLITVVPVVRGDGIYQPGVDWAIEKLNQGDWVHIFPEGEVNMTKEPMRLKWGVARMIMEAKNQPIILPFWHEGMDDLLPNYRPYIPRPCKFVTFVVGERIQVQDILEEHKKKKLSLAQTRIRITNHIQDRLYKLGSESVKLHQNRCQIVNNSPE